MPAARSAKSVLFRALTDAAAPAWFVDRQMKLLWANDALGRWTGVEPQELIGQTCVWQTSLEGSPTRNVLNALCPPPHALDGPAVEFRVSNARDEGANTLHAVALAFGRDSDAVVLVVCGNEGTESDETGASDEFDSRELHRAIARMQRESASRIPIDMVTGRSAAAIRVRRQMEIVAQTGSTAIILGPPGSGRRRIAQVIHFAGEPALAGPLVPIDCGAGDAESIQEVIKNLYREHRRWPDEPLGRLLLRDIDQLPEAGQRELRGFLQLPDFRLPMLATGSPEARDHLDPELWMKLSTVVIELPSLSQRREDLAYLLQATLEQGNGAGVPQFSGFERAAMDCLTRYDWPGELAELVEVVESARKQGGPPVIRFNDLPSHVRIAVRSAGTKNDQESTIDLDRFLADVELELIGRAVAAAGGNKAQAARLLGISRGRLLRRLPDDVDGSGGDWTAVPRAVENSDGDGRGDQP